MKQENTPENAQAVCSADAALAGRWYLQAVEVPAVGIRRELADPEDYCFDLQPDGTAVVHIHGDTYGTKYRLWNGRLTFAHAKLAALLLTVDADGLRIQNYLGATMIFKRLSAAGQRQPQADAT